MASDTPWLCHLILPLTALQYIYLFLPFECLEIQVAESGRKRSVDDAEQQPADDDNDDDDKEDDTAAVDYEELVVDASESSVKVNESSALITAPRDTAFDRDQMLTRSVFAYIQKRTSSTSHFWTNLRTIADSRTSQCSQHACLNYVQCPCNVSM